MSPGVIDAGRRVPCNLDGDPITVLGQIGTPDLIVLNYPLPSIGGGTTVVAITA